MKQLIRKILREQEEEIITLPPFSFFGYDWNEVLEYADDRLFRVNDDIDLSSTEIKTLGGLVEVGGNLNLFNCINLKTLDKLRSVDGWLNLWDCKNLQSLGELRSVGGYLDLLSCENLQSLGKLEYVGGSLDITYTYIPEKMTDDEIRNQIDIKGRIISE